VPEATANPEETQDARGEARGGPHPAGKREERGQFPLPTRRTWAKRAPKRGVLSQASLKVFRRGYHEPGRLANPCEGLPAREATCSHGAWHSQRPAKCLGATLTNRRGDEASRVGQDGAAISLCQTRRGGGSKRDASPCAA